MPFHSTIATAIDKTKIASTVAYVLMAQVDVLDPTTYTTVETLYFANNNDQIQWQGNTYAPCAFSLDATYEQGKLPSVSIVFHDFFKVIQARLQAYNGALGSSVRIVLVNTSVTDNPPDFDETFTITSTNASASDYTITFSLGAENPLNLRFPPRLQFRDRCMWLYKGVECGYTGTLSTCDYTLKGTNGCEVHNNTLRFGGFPGIQSQQTQLG